MIWAALVGAGLLGLWLFGERGRLLRPSTWRMVRISGWRRFLKLTTAHGYVYARWTYQYVKLGSQIIAPLLGEQGKRWLATHYHGKVLPTELAQALVTVQEDIPLHSLEQIVPFPVARDLVLNGPPDIALYECPCRQLRANPCTPTQVCMVVGQPFVDFMLEHHPRGARRITQAEAVELLQAEHDRGHVHTAWFKDAAAGRFYAICNCCSCCCGGIEAMMRHGIPMLIPSGYVSHIDPQRCSACGRCVRGCPFGALRWNGDTIQGDRTVILNWEACLGCGVCQALCPSGAISLLRDEAKGMPLDVRLLLSRSPTE
ncbi:MAG: ferredoxin family protein [Chloroflexi bacterium]|nr:ferredoxin family protein [Chloroflexota bacterium]